MSVYDEELRHDEDDGKTPILLGVDAHRVIDEAVAALQRDRTLYRRAGSLAHVVVDDGPNDQIDRSRAPRIINVTLPNLLDRITRIAACTKSGKPELPPAWLVEGVAARGQWPGIRRLDGIVTTPVLRPDGSILSAPGYDQTTGLLSIPDGEYDVPAAPTQGDAVKALELLAEVVADFPFATPAHRSAWAAGVLTPLARHAFDGPAPLFLFDANTRGSGKSLLTDVTSLIVFGRPMARFANPRNDDEARKRITSIAIAGDPAVLIDNVAGKFGCPSMDAALTGVSWSDRLMGRSEIITLPLRAVWYASGNNIVLAADTARRVCHIRLDSPLENPEQRDDFRHPDLRGWVQANRPRLRVAGLTVLAAYCRAGRPPMKLPAWGSFEGWSLVREALVWAGWPDPADTRQELTDTADSEAAALVGLIAGWQELDAGGTGVTTGEALKRLKANPDRHDVLREAIGELCSASGGDLPSARSLGNAMANFRRRVVGGRALDYRTGKGRTRRWRVITTQTSYISPPTSDSDGEGDSSDSGDTDSTIPTRDARAHAHASSAETVSPVSPVSPPGDIAESLVGLEGLP